MMYNQERKQRFLEEFYGNEDTKRKVAYTFDNTEGLESSLNSDLCDFTNQQFYDLLRDFKCLTENALLKHLTQIKQYAEWSSNNGYTVNPTLFEVTKRDLKEYLDADELKNQYITDRDALYRICDALANPVDQAIIVGLYEGIYGEDMLLLRTLRKEDVHDREIVAGNRVFPNIDKRSIRIMKEAIDKTEYFNKNGESIAKAPKRYMIDSKYVIRPTKMHNNDGMPITSEGINDKFKNIKLWLGIGHLNATNIFYRGIFEKLEMIEYNRKLEATDYKYVFSCYGLNPDSYVNLKDKYSVFKNHYQNRSLESNNIRDFILPQPIQEDYATDNETNEFDLIVTDTGFPEGKEKLMQHLSRERNRKVIELARQAYKNQYKKLCCEICGFDFSKVYGDIGIDFIEGHHLKPISEIPIGYKTRISDICLVCSNCHSMLHRKRPWITVDNLKQLLE